MGKLQTYFYLGLLGAIVIMGVLLAVGTAIRHLVSFARAGGLLATSVLLAIVLAGLAFIALAVVGVTIAAVTGPGGPAR